MTPELAQTALQFFERVTLRGVEVRAFLAVQNALISLASQKAETADVIDSAPVSQ